MGTLRNQMTEAMKLRGFSPRTQQSYLAAVTALARYYRTSPDQLDFEKIKGYLLYLTVERALSWSTCKLAVSAFRFFYSCSGVISVPLTTVAFEHLGSVGSVDFMQVSRITLN